MTTTPRTSRRTTSDAAVRERTGRDWAGWFTLLDAAGAQALDHRARVQLLTTKYGVPAWWRQMVAVEYERERGLRERHQTAGGYSVSVSRTLTLGLGALYGAAANAAQRRRWFPKGRFVVSSQTPHKYLRGRWQEHARLEFGFTGKGPAKAQIAVQVSHLADRAQVEAQRAAWKAAFAKLAALHTPR